MPYGGNDRSGRRRCRAGEAARGRRRWQFGRGLLLQGLHQDALDAAHVDEVHFQCSAAGGIEALGSVALAEAEQLVPLPDLGPRQRAVEEALSEFAHRRPQLGSLVLDVVRRPGGVGRELGGIVVGIGGAAAPGLAEVGLDQLAPVIDAHQLAVHLDLHLPARRAQAGRHRVQSLAALDVVVLVHLGLAPVGDLVGLAIPGNQSIPLLILEDHQGLSPRGAVDAQTGDVAAPVPGLLPDIGQVFELAALEKALSGVGHASLHLGLVLGMTGPGRVGDEAPVLGVFQEAPGEDGMQRVGHRHRRRAIVDDQVAGMPPKKAQADSSPAITSSNVWLKVGQTKQCLE